MLHIAHILYYIIYCTLYGVYNVSTALAPVVQERPPFIPEAFLRKLERKQAMELDDDDEDALQLATRSSRASATAAAASSARASTSSDFVSDPHARKQVEYRNKLKRNIKTVCFSLILLYILLLYSYSFMPLSHRTSSKRFNSD